MNQLSDNCIFIKIFTEYHETALICMYIYFLRLIVTYSCLSLEDKIWVSIHYNTIQITKLINQEKRNTAYR